jgi:signal transduction histidine kinase
MANSRRSDELDGVVASFGGHADAARDAATRMRQLLEVTAALTRAVTARDVAQAVATRVVRALGARAASMSVVDRASRTIEVLAAPGYDADVAARWPRFALDADVPLAHVMRTAEPLWLTSVGDTRAHFPRFDVTPLADTPATAIVPLLLERGERGEDGGSPRVLGAIAVSFAAERDFPSDDRALLEAIAAQAAQALERARLYEAERMARGEAERLRAEADRANRLKSEFVATMSHELRTPLNAISGHVDLLELGLHGPLLPAQLESLGRVRRAQEQLLLLINDALAYARIEGGRVEYNLRDVAVADVVADLRPIVDPLVGARALTLRVRLGVDGDGGPPLRVRADPDKLRQILINLLSNAIKFTPPGGQVDVEVARRADGSGPADVAFIRVRDTGHGIPPDKLGAIFEPFVQVRTGAMPARGRDEGTGLGLAISRDLARGMGGDLRARSIEHAGASFTLALPRAACATSPA